MLGKIPVKGMQRPDITIAVDLDVRHQFKQTHSLSYMYIKPKVTLSYLTLKMISRIWQIQHGTTNNVKNLIHIQVRSVFNIALRYSEIN